MTIAQELGFSPLLLPDPKCHAIDVVFIHGLNGHRSKTWKNESSETWPLWLRDDLDGVRAWTYGYDASIAVRSEEDVKDHSAMFESHFPNQSHSYIFNATAGIVFLSTPHRGSQWATRLAFGHLGTSLFQAKSDLVHLLQAHSQELATVGERFNSVWGAKPVLSCCETKRTHGVGMIVRKEYAKTNCVGEIVVDIDADHRGMAKPPYKGALMYKTIVEFLKSIQSEATQLQATIEPSKRISAPRESLTKEQKQRRKILRHQLWDQLHSGPKPDQDAWMAISEEWEGEEEGKRSKWMGGLYVCKFPPGSTDTTIQIEVDITQDITPVLWTIETNADNPFYPGRHTGKLEFPEGYPMQQIFIIWVTPVFSPYVRFTSGQGDVSSPFDLGKWSPFYTVQHVLQTMANFLALQPLCRHPPPPFAQATVDIPWRFSDLSKVAGLASTDEDAFYHAAQFFARAYNRVGRAAYDPSVDEFQRQASITAIRELVAFYLDGQPPVPRGRFEADYTAAFNGVGTNSEWIAEERLWADALSQACGFGFRAFEM